MIIGTIYFYCRVLGFMVERFTACGFGSGGGAVALGGAAGMRVYLYQRPLRGGNNFTFTHQITIYSLT